MSDLRAAKVVCCGWRMSSCRSGREVEKRTVRWRGGVKDGESEGEDGREGVVGTVRFGRDGLVDGGEEEDIVTVMELLLGVLASWFP
jgi:hypothetical protein